jgi:hypothetical protein
VSLIANVSIGIQGLVVELVRMGKISRVVKMIAVSLKDEQG